MKFKSIVSLALSVVILFSSVGSAKAVEGTNAAYFAKGSFWDQMLFGLVTGAAEWPFGDAVQDIAAVVCGEICPSSEDGLHRTSRAGLLGRPTGFHPNVGRYGVAVCDHCGKEFKLYSGDLSERGRGFVDALDDTEASSVYKVGGFTASSVLSASASAIYLFAPLADKVVSTFDVSTVAYLSRLLVNLIPESEVLIVCALNASNYYGYYWDSDSRLHSVIVDSGVGSLNGTFFGVHSKDSLSISTDSVLSVQIYRSKDIANSIVTSSYIYVPEPSNSASATGWNFTLYERNPSGVWTDAVAHNLWTFNFGSSKRTLYYPDYATALWHGSQIVEQPINTDSSSRLSALTAALNEWNQQNKLESGSTVVNYYISPVDSDGTYFHPGLYDEETLVYSDPVTGTEYLTNGWTYDYLTRCYTLDMADGFTIGDTAIDTIKLTYGDELLTVDHYSGGSLIRSDEYNYVMVSGSECGLNGHSYTYENVKDPTCTTMGERKYTCSVCGDQYAENVPASGHAHVFSILKEATCTAAGIGVYSCSTCGSEYTETIPATNHTGQLIETVPSEFDENGVLISRGYSVYECSVCGTQYTVQDEISTDDGDWFSFMGDLLKSFLKTIVTALGAGLSKLFSAIADFFAWIFGFLSETVLSGIKNFFTAFGDDSSIFDGFRQENEDGASTVALPSGVATVFQFVSGTILLLPDDLRLVLIFGVAALFLIAVFKSRP